MSDKGLLVVVSGPAGSGKGTTVKSILGGGSAHDAKVAEKFRCSVSATTRDPRPGETDGVSYYFITHDEFRGRIERGEMLEYTEYCGNYYGTPKSEVEDSLSRGINVILEIEVDGGGQIKRMFPDAVLVMLLPPDFRTLEQRLRDRGTNTPEDIANRLEKAKLELECFDSYDYVVVNNDNAFDAAADEIINICRSEKNKTSRKCGFKEEFFR